MPAQAEVELTSGEFYTTTNDLVIKVMGGQVEAQRTWYKGKWEFNRAWNPLDITYDNDTGAVISIGRNNDLYKKSTGGDVYTLEFEKRRTITKTTDGFRWADRNGNWIDYDINGRILRFGDRNNVTNTLIYDTEGRRSGVQDHFGNQVLWYAYDTNGKLISVRDHADVAQARQVQYHYTGDLLTSVTDVLGKTWTYTYTNDVLTRIEDPDGRITETSYGAAGRVSDVKNPDGTVVSHKFDYDKLKKQFYSRRSYNDGTIIEFWFDKAGKLIRRDVNGITIAKGIFDGRRRETTNELGHTTIREYDEWDNVIKITHPDNSSFSYKYDTKYSNLLEEKDERGIVTKYEYDTNGNLTRMTEAVGKPEQRITEYTYDDFGNLLTEKRLGDAITEETLTTYTFDEYGNINTKTVSVSATESHIINYDGYDRMGNLLQWRDGRGKSWKQTYNEKGWKTSKTDPLNHTYSYEYDSYGNITLITNPGNHNLRFVYNKKNQLERVNNADNAEYRFAYNDKGQLTSLYDEENIVKHIGYDEQGRQNQFIDGVGNNVRKYFGVVTNQNVTSDLISAVEYPTYRKEFHYDSRERLLQTVVNYDSNTTYTNKRSYDVAGNLTSITDAEQNVTSYEVDAFGRRIQVTHPDSTVEKYAYDNRDNLLNVRNERNVVIRKYVYDQKNRVTQEIWPNGQTHKYFYDENDNLIEKIDAKGQFSRLKYDDANRLSQVTFFSDSIAVTPNKSIGFTYNSLNKLTGYDDGETSATYNYDNLQRKISETIDFGAFTKSLTYTYKKNGRKASFTDPSGVTVTYSYDLANRLAKVALPGEGNITYNSYQWNEPTKLTFPGGSTRELLYDPLMRISQIIAKDPAQNVLLNHHYYYDKVGNIQIKNTEHGKYIFDYDNRYRLIAAENPTLSDESFSYDVTGNRLSDSETKNEWEYTTSNQLTRYGDISIGYDKNGNRISQTVAGEKTTYVYNLQNRLTEVKDNNGNIISAYYYDPFGRRLWKDTNGTRTYFMYVDEGLLAEINASGDILKTYGYQPHKSYGTSALYSQNSKGYEYYQSDNNGSPQALINKNGQIQWLGHYQSFDSSAVISFTFPND